MQWRSGHKLWRIWWWCLLNLSSMKKMLNIREMCREMKKLKYSQNSNEQCTVTPIVVNSFWFLSVWLIWIWLFLLSCGGVVSSGECALVRSCQASAAGARSYMSLDFTGARPAVVSRPPSSEQSSTSDGAMSRPLRAQTACSSTISIHEPQHWFQISPSLANSHRRIW